MEDSDGNSFSTSTSVTVKVDVDINDNANTVILDFAAFDLIGQEKEIQQMQSYIKNTPEYKYGDILDIRPHTTVMSGRDYLEFEEALVRDGIVRQVSNVNYSYADEIWRREDKFTFNPNSTINRSYFLACLGRVAGNKDNIFLSSQSVSKSPIASNLNSQGGHVGRQHIETSPYQKDIQGQVDLGTSVVIIDYNNRNYNLVKLNNIYKPYIKYLKDINVIQDKELKSNINLLDGTKDYDLIRPNYSSIPISSPIVNNKSSKDFESYPTDDINLVKSNTRMATYDLLDEYTESYDGKRFVAKIPDLMLKSEMNVMDALGYIYRYLKYHEEETVLNDLEVDAVTALYGLKFTNYTKEEIVILKYLIAKGIVNPYEDDLTLFRKELRYKDVLKFIYRVAYSEKRFDFKSVSLSSDDIRLAREGYCQDKIVIQSNPSSIDIEFEKAKEDFSTALIDREKSLGYMKIYLEIPREEYDRKNFVLSSSQDLDVTFPISPIDTPIGVYGEALIPKIFTKKLVLRSTALGGGYSLKLDTWEDFGIYNIGDNQKYIKISNFKENQDIATNRFLANDVTIAIDRNKEYSYSGVKLFQGEQDNRILNPDLEDVFKLDGSDGLILKDVSTWAEAQVILSRFSIPPNTSSDELTFMGYSQLTVNGDKITMIRDTDLNKLGIEKVQDNVLYNRKLNLYGYLDPRTSILYYGNTIVKYKEGTLMLEGLEGHDAVFYNLDVVKTLLSNVGTNKGISNEVLTILPSDESIGVYENKDLQNYVYMHPQNEEDRIGDWWINASTLSGRSSNLIFFKDTASGLHMMLNFRARALKSGNNQNNNCFDELLTSLKTKTMEVHPGINPILQSILGYEGKFSIKDYNYGVTILYEGGENAEYKKKHALNAVWNLLAKESDRDYFVGCWNSDADFAGVELPNALVRAINPEYDTAGRRNIRNVSQYFAYAKEAIDPELKQTVYLSVQEVDKVDMLDKLKSVSNSLPAKMLNNNIYFRFQNHNNFNDIAYSGSYRFLDSLIFLYKLDPDKKELNIISEKINYENTGSGYIPLEEWQSEIPIGDWRYIKKICLYLKNNAGVVKPYLFDVIEYTGTEDINKDIEITISKNDTISTVKEKVFKKYLSQDLLLQESWDRSISKKIIESPNYMDSNLSMLFSEIFSNKVNEVDFGSEDLIIKEIGAKKIFKSNRKIFPSGTILINVGNDGSNLKLKNDYELKYSINARPRTALGNSFDLLNQNLAQLNSENLDIKDVPAGGSLILPSGVVAYALGNSQFLIQENKKLEYPIDNEVILIWRYLKSLNVRVGSSSILLNGIEEIHVPFREDITNKYLEIFNDMSNKFGSGINIGGLSLWTIPSKLVFRDGNVIKTGKIDKSSATITEDSASDLSANVFPIIKIADNVKVAKLQSNGLYMLKDVSGSVDLGFVNYLEEGVTYVNKADYTLSNDSTTIDVSSNDIKNVETKSVLILLSKAFNIIRLCLAMFLLWYSLSCIIFLIAINIEIARNFCVRYLKPVMFSFLSVSSYDEYSGEVNIVHAFIKSFAVLALSIAIWALWLK